MGHNKAYEASEIRIREAFMRVLQRKFPEKISVADIVRESGIDRSTFYAHYPNGITEFLNMIKEEDLLKMKGILMALVKCDDQMNDRDPLLYEYIFNNYNRPMELGELLRDHGFIEHLELQEQFLVNQSLQEQSKKGIELDWRKAARIRSIWGSFTRLSVYYLLHAPQKKERQELALMIQANAQELLEIAFSEET